MSKTKTATHHPRSALTQARKPAMPSMIRPPKASALAVIAAIYNNSGDLDLPAVLQQAEAALDRAIGHPAGLLDVITQAAEDLNRAARPDTYGPPLAQYDAAMKAPSQADPMAALEAAGQLRGHDTEAAFAIGLAAGLRLGGAR